MKDYSQYSDADLLQMAGVIPPDNTPQQVASGTSPQGDKFTAVSMPVSQADTPIQGQVTARKDYSQYSDVDLIAMAGINPEDTSLARTGLDYGLRGATFGLGNRLSNAVGALGAAAITGEPVGSLYNEAVANQKQRMDAELQQNPKTAIGSELIGGLGTGGALAGTATGGAVANGISRGLLPEATGFFGNVGNAVSKAGLSGATGVASGVLYGAGTADPGQMLENAKKNAITNGVIGALIPGATSALGAVKNSVLPLANDIIKPLAQKALDYGIPLSRTQIGDSAAAKTIASASGKIPLSGAAGFQKTQQTAFNKQVLDTIGVNATKATPDVIKSAYTKISNQFDSALKGQEVTINDDMVNQLASIDKKAFDELTPDNYGIVKKQIDRFFSLLSEDGTMQGEKLGNLRSDLAAQSRGGGSEKRYIGQLKNFVQDVSVAGAPDRKAALQDAIEKFRNYQVVKPLLNKAVSGDISPSLLLGRVSSNFGDFAQGGGGKLGDLARIGQAFLKDPIPDSGTAQRALVYKAIGGLGALGGGYVAPAAIAPAIVGLTAARGLNTLNTNQALVRRALQLKLKSGTLLPNVLAGQAALQYQGAR